MKKVILSICFLLGLQSFAQDQGEVRLRCGSLKMVSFDTYITIDEYNLIRSGKPLAWPLAKTEIFFVKENFPLIMIVDSATGSKQALSCDKVN